jgi:hypothetical protein
MPYGVPGAKTPEALSKSRFHWMKFGDTHVLQYWRTKSVLMMSMMTKKIARHMMILKLAYYAGVMTYFRKVQSEKGRRRKWRD